jgi:hypothetical protein
LHADTRVLDRPPPQQGQQEVGLAAAAGMAAAPVIVSMPLAVAPGY